jgi:hypothetical protein
MKLATSLLCFLLCALSVSPVRASLAVSTPFSDRDTMVTSSPFIAFMDVTAKIPAISDLWESLRHGTGPGLSLLRDSLSTSEFTSTIAFLKAARTMVTADARQTGGASTSSVGDTLMSGIPATLEEVSTAIGSSSGGFFFESPDAPGSGIGIATVSSSTATVRMLSSYQTIEPPATVPLPPAFLLFGTGLAGCCALRRTLRRERFAPTTM